MAYEVRVASRRVEKQLDTVPDEYYARTAAAIQGLADDPRPMGVKKLGGHVHRIRMVRTGLSIASMTKKSW